MPYNQLSDLNRANFSAKEFYFSTTAVAKKIDNQPKEQATLGNLMHLADRMQMLRNVFDKPIHITSGYRCEELNTTLKASKKDSYHMLGLAADFVIHGMSPIEIARKLKDNFDCDKLIASYQWSEDSKSWKEWTHIQFNQDSKDNRNYFLLEKIKNGSISYDKII